MLVMLTGYSGPPAGPEALDPPAAGTNAVAEASATAITTGIPARPGDPLPAAQNRWPNPDLRAGPRPASELGIRVRLPRARPTGPACTVPKALSGSVERRRPEQVLLVTADGTRARVVGCERGVDGYVQVLGPFRAWVGRQGVARPGRKREGDGRTPAGVFTLGSGFGTDNPGLTDSFGWLRIGRADVWVDDPRSRFYNTHQRGPAHGRWRSAEKLRIKPYRTAQVIDYNQARTRGRGSAIFLHLATDRPTAGCVALASGPLRAVMRWERTDVVIAIS